MASSDDLTLALVAGEASGDLLASRLLSGLRPMLPEVRLHGIGGPAMAEYGFVSDYPMEKLAVRGLFEVLSHYRELKALRDELREQLLMERPAVFVGVDAPDFNLDLEIQLKQAGIPTLHFVSPSVWAWRRGRIKKIGRAVSHLLVIFPFEEAIYNKAGIPVTYVGHPLAEMIPMDPDQDAARDALGIERDARVVTILPGSRLSELKHNTRVFLETAAMLKKRDPKVQFLMPMAGDTQRAFVEQLMTPDLKALPLQIMTGGSHNAIAACDAALVASGTATLEVALFKKPMVISYRMNPASWQVLRLMAYQPWVGLPNIMAREFLVPELLQDRATPAGLSSALWAQLSNDQNRQRLRRRFVDLHHDLMRNTASQSAHAVMELLSQAGRL
ncbi:MAG: lipid-A-disaccharide synthase [Burkholderiales bacterium]|nr:lipid-A-disaccharide synthase [Burkholderiales bacterium]NCW85308.1 lipid-A-disaccharide synthase [Oxalobacteraceae bacterium]